MRRTELVGTPRQDSVVHKTILARTNLRCILLSDFAHTKEVYMYRAVMATLLLFAASMSAMGADNGFYIGAAVGQAGVKADDLDESLPGEVFDGDDTGFKAIVGFRPLEWFAVEANYVDLGSAEDDVGGLSLNVDVTGIDAFGVVFLPLPVVDIFFKAGVISWDSEASVSGFGEVSDEDGTDLAYGAGVGLGFGSFGARLEYERFEIEDADTVDMISLGVTWTFL
jgi:Outer membrane protein beta-barrel domain